MARTTRRVLLCLCLVALASCGAYAAVSDSDLEVLLHSPVPSSPVAFSPVAAESPVPAPEVATFPSIAQLPALSPSPSMPGSSPPQSGPTLARRFTTPSGEERRLRYRGVATTAYGAAPISSYGAVNFGCGLGYVSSNFTSAYIGVGSSFFQQGYSCGQCVRLQCDDDTCRQAGRTVIAQIIDSCGNCFDADISIANPLFQSLTGRAPSPNPSALVSWEFIDCAPYMNGTIKMLVKPGGSVYYQAFNFANSIYTITNAEMNGVLLTHGADNYWAWNPVNTINPAGPFQLALLGATGEILRVTLPQLRSVDLGVQFTTHTPSPPPPRARPPPSSPPPRSPPPHSPSTPSPTAPAAPAKG